MSTFTTSKGFEQPAHGSDNDTWDVPMNSNFGAIDASLAGHTSINVTGVNTGAYQLTLTQYQPPNIVFTGTMSGPLTYIVPTNVGGRWSVLNNTTGGFNLLFQSGASSYKLLPQGVRITLVCDGTNMDIETAYYLAAAPSALVGLTPVNGSAFTVMNSASAPALDQSITPTWTGAHIFAGTVSLSSAVGLGANLALSAAGSINATGGAITVPTQSPSDNSAKAASTAYVTTAAATAVSTAETFATNADTTVLSTAETYANGTVVKTANGHVILPNGLIIQWGNSTFASTISAITFSSVTGCIAFPTACLWATMNASGSSATAYTVSWTATTLTGVNGISGTNTWIAIGY